MLDFLYSIIYGIIQGITEWLPISSTGHLILAKDFFKLSTSDAFFEMFLVIIQLGSIAAVIILFWNKLWPFKMKKQGGIGVKVDTFRLWLKVIVGIIPALIFGLLLDNWSDSINNKVVVAIALIFYGIMFIVVEKVNRGKATKINSLDDISYPLALCVGAFQALALIPGTSRSGATILGAIILGFWRPVAAEFSFFLAIPTMFGASFIRIVKYFSSGGTFGGSEIMILAVGTIVSFIVSIFAIRFLMKFIQKKDFVPFGYYRIALGILVLALIPVVGIN
jgi:undecaprenyl-diphosphatase uppP